MTSRNFPVEWARKQFPAIAQADAETPPFIFSDNAAGAQVPYQALAAMNEFMTSSYALEGAHYERSSLMQERIGTVKEQTAHFLGAASVEDVLFGLNASTTLRLFATSLGEKLTSGDEIIISGIEHEANVSPWLRLQQRGIVLKFWQPRGSEHRLQNGDLKALLSDRTRVVAVTAASNLLGTVPSLRPIADLAHEHGAIVVVDGVHYAPHRRINVQDWDVDFFVSSGYKIFGPRVSLSWCRPELMQVLPSLNHYFLAGHKLEMGAPNYEGIAGMGGVYQYFAELASELGIENVTDLDALFAATGDYENKLTVAMLEGLLSNDRISLYGIKDSDALEERVSTFSINLKGYSPEELSKALCSRGIGCRYGHFYAARLADHLRVSSIGGVVRISLSHYNTMDEVERILAVIGEL